MSGGVDSSVAAARCVAGGVETLGITLAMWPGDREQVRDRGCCSIDAVEDARRVANHLGIRHLTWNLESEFSAEVVADFEAGYAAGRTPNPCVRCNQRVKFGVLLSRARAIGATHVATGHYARIGRRGAGWTLHRAREAAKDQAYTLHRLDQAQLGAALFPLGRCESKSEVRAEAVQLELVTAATPDSQELCFVGGDRAADLSRRLAGRFRPGPDPRPGGARPRRAPRPPLLHGGAAKPAGPQAGPARRRPPLRPRARRRLQPGGGGPRRRLRRVRLRAGDCRWVGGAPPEAGARVEAQLRAHGRPHVATGGRGRRHLLELRFGSPPARCPRARRWSSTGATRCSAGGWWRWHSCGPPLVPAGPRAPLAVMLGCAGVCLQLLVCGAPSELALPRHLGWGRRLSSSGLVGERNCWRAGRPDSVWVLSVKVPLVPLYLDEVTIAGLIVALLGLSLVLFLERVVPPERRWTPPPAAGPRRGRFRLNHGGAAPHRYNLAAMSRLGSRPASGLPRKHLGAGHA